TRSRRASTSTSASGWPRRCRTTRCTRCSRAATSRCTGRRAARRAGRANEARYASATARGSALRRRGEHLLDPVGLVPAAVRGRAGGLGRVVPPPPRVIDNARAALREQVGEGLAAAAAVIDELGGDACRDPLRFGPVRRDRPGGAATRPAGDVQPF